MSVPTYCERLRRRQRIWWGDGEPGNRTGWRARLHREREWRTFRRRDDPDEAWRCCEHWPRSLINKWNGREFAARHGLAVPRLYWRRFPFARLPVETLPPEFVLRAVRGHGRSGVLVVDRGREVLRDEAVSPRALRHRMRRGGVSAWTIAWLAEERLRGVDGASLPLEIKCLAFGGTVAATQVIHRRGVKQAAIRFYTPSWEPLGGKMLTSFPEAPPEPPPTGLESMVAAAARIGAAVGTYLRVDFFATANGPVFNEFSSVPGGGRGYTPYGDAFLGAAWAEHIPDAI